MKQGKLINRIMMLVLLAAVVVYLAASAWRSFRDPYTFVMSYAYTVDDSLEATGFLVREETVLSGGGGTVELLPEEGEKVARGETVALLYQSGEGLERRQELESLTLEREQLEYALERAQTGGDASQLSQQVLDAIADLHAFDGADGHHCFGKGSVQFVKYRFSETGGRAVDDAFDDPAGRIFRSHAAFQIFRGFFRRFAVRHVQLVVENFLP